MALVDRGGKNGFSARHYIGNFELTPANKTPASPKPSHQPASATQATQPTRTPAAEPKARAPSTKPAAMPQTTVQVHPKKNPPAVLDSAQKESIHDGLNAREHLIRNEMLVQIRAFVDGKISGITLVPGDMERRIFHLLGIPGF